MSAAALPAPAEMRRISRWATMPTRAPPFQRGRRDLHFSRRQIDIEADDACNQVRERQQRAVRAYLGVRIISPGI